MPHVLKFIMKRNNMKYIVLSRVTLLLLLVYPLTSCDDWKERFGDCPPECGDCEPECPYKGQVTLITEWDNRSEGVDIPSEHIAVVGGFWGKLSGTTNMLDHNFNPGDHNVNVFNIPENMMLDKLTAVVKHDGKGIDPMPGFLFTWTGEVLGLEDEENRTIVAPMIQQVGVLTYELIMEDGSPVGEYVSAVSAKLDGVARAIDIETGDLSLPSYFKPEFNMTPDGVKYTAESRMLGTIGNSQMLELELTLAGSEEIQVLSKDIASILDGFNDDKLGSYHIIIKITGVDGLTGVITGWIIMDGLHGNID